MAKKTFRPLPPCPDPERYILVRTKEGDFWRLRRGLKSPAPLNETLSRQAEWMKMASPAAKKVVQALWPFLAGLQTGRLTVSISSLLRRSLKEQGHMDFTCCRGLELQPDYPLDRLLRGGYLLERMVKEAVVLRIHGGPGRIRPKGRLVTGCRFEAVLLSGDPGGEEDLQTLQVVSDTYPISSEAEVRLTVPLPAADIPWLLCLKVVCLEGETEVPGPGGKGMKVVGAG